MSQMQNLGLVKGADGVSPTVIVAEDTDDSYKLSITDKRGTIVTPNLKGQGSSSSGGIGEAPKDGKQYARQNGTWSVVNTNESLSVSGQTILGGLYTYYDEAKNNLYQGTRPITAEDIV